MEQLKLTIGLVLAVLLQWTLRNIAEPLAYIDFPLIIVVYAAFQRNSIRAILFGAVAGLAVDALSGGLLGANGFTKTLIAFIVSEIARRVYMDNLLLRIPVIAGASILNSVVYFSLSRLLGQPPNIEPLFVGAYSLIATTIAGTIIYYSLEHMSSESMRPRTRRESFSSRRQTRRRNPIRLAK